MILRHYFEAIVTVTVDLHPRTCRRVLDRLTVMQQDAVNPAKIQRYLSRWTSWWHSVTRLEKNFLISKWVIFTDKIRPDHTWFGRGLLLGSDYYKSGHYKVTITFSNLNRSFVREAATDRFISWRLKFMKTQNWGEHLWKDDMTPVGGYPILASPGKIPFSSSSFCRDIEAIGVVAFLPARFNFVKPTYIYQHPPTPPEALFDDCAFKVIKGTLRGDYIYGPRCADGGYEYEVRYDAGPRSRAWLEEQDKKYLGELLSSGKLKEVEPEVWYMRETDQAQNMDIGDWWVRKWAECTDKTGDEMAKKLELAEQEYNQYGERLLQEAKAEAKRKLDLEAAQERTAREAQKQAKREAQERAIREARTDTERAVLTEIGRCALCGKIMLDPVVAADGETYEREEIERWLQTHDTSPKTRDEVLAHKNLTSNKATKRLVERLLQTYPELWQSDEVYFSETLKQRLLTAVREQDAVTVVRSVKHDQRLLTRGLDDNGTKLLLLALDSNCAVLQTVVHELGAERLRALPEVVADDGVACFRLAATHLATAGARIIAEALKWSQETIQTRFAEALIINDLNLVDACLDLGANLEAADPRSIRPLHWAVDNGRYDLVRLLIARDAERDAPNNDGNTALHLAVIKGDVAALRILCESLEQNSAQAACPVAASTAAAELKPATYAAVANPLAVLDVLNPKNQLSALHMALSNIQAHPEQKEHFAIAQLLINAGANLELPNAAGDTPLLQAVRGNSPELLVLLLANQPKPDLEKTDRAGNTPLHLAFNLGFLELIPLLVNAGANLETKDKDGNTALLRAVIAKRSVIQHLVQQMLARSEHPAEINAVNNAEENALHLVARQGDIPQSQELAVFLLEKGIDGLAMNSQGEEPKTAAFKALNRAMANLISKKILELEVKRQLQGQSPPRISPPPTRSPHPAIAGLQPEDVIEFTTLQYGEHLGEGSFAKVYRGTWQQRGSERNVAIKELLTPGLSSQAAQELVSEASVMKQLRHINVLSLFGICVEPGHYSLVMEYMPRGSLYGVLHSSEPITWIIRWDIALGVARGIGHLHDHRPQILHRDLKSLNVLLDENNVPKLTDFGLSQVRTETLRTTASRQHVGQNAAGVPAGTFAWMAPELISDLDASYTRACDVFSFGVIMWEIASRQIPWARPGRVISEMQIGAFVSSGRRKTIPQNTPKTYAALIERCWAQRTEDRPVVSVATQELEQHRNEVVVPVIPEEFICPITGEIMREPTIDRDGHTFERAAIEEWVGKRHTCPNSRIALQLEHLSPNRALRDMIEQFLQANPAVQRGATEAPAATAAASSEAPAAKAPTGPGGAIIVCEKRRIKN